MNSNDTLQGELEDAIQTSLLLLNDALKKQELKGTKFQIYFPATEDEMTDVFDYVKDKEPSIGQYDTSANLKNRPWLQKFLKHCCKCWAYVFCIKKCGKDECDICKPPRLSPDVFDDIHFLPDPKPNEKKDHYLPFAELYGSPEDESEKYLPSKKSKTGHGFPNFQPSVQTAKNVSSTVQCTDCRRKRVMYSARKLRIEEGTLN